MAQLLIRNLSDEVKERLRRRAERHGRSLEAEAREILEHAAVDTAPLQAEGFGTQLARKIAAIGTTKEDVDELERIIADDRQLQRDRLSRPIDFGE